VRDYPCIADTKTRHPDLKVLELAKLRALDRLELLVVVDPSTVT
jgi:hypothetical protein